MSIQVFCPGFMNQASFLDQQHFTSMDQFALEDLGVLFERSDLIDKDPGAIIDGRYDRKVLGSLFLEPSTRTRLSFESAMSQLGGKVLQIPGSQELSLAKGESTADSIRTINTYVNALVARTPDSAMMEEICRYSNKTVISGGDGTNEHPTQTLMDLYTIQKEKGRIDGLNIVVAGDLKLARVIHSLIRGLSYYDVSVTLVSPPELKLPQELLHQCSGRSAQFLESTDLKEAITKADVLYMVKLQDHRIDDIEEVRRLQKNYPHVDVELLRSAKDDLRILHPMVRKEEIDVEIDDLPQAAYFRQLEYGLTLRMALLSFILDRKNV